MTSTPRYHRDAAATRVDAFVRLTDLAKRDPRYARLLRMWLHGYASDNQAYCNEVIGTASALHGSIVAPPDLPLPTLEEKRTAEKTPLDYSYVNMISRGQMDAITTAESAVAHLSKRRARVVAEHDRLRPVALAIDLEVREHRPAKKLDAADRASLGELIKRVYPAEAPTLGRKSDAFVAAMALGGMASEIAGIDRGIREALAADRLDAALARSGTPSRGSIEESEQRLKDALRMRSVPVAPTAHADDEDDDEVVVTGTAEEVARAKMILAVSRHHPSRTRGAK